MIDFLNNAIEFWHWIILGIVLSLVEIFIPSFFMLWIGISAIIVGIVLSIIAISFNQQLILWIVLSVLCLVFWFRYLSPIMKTRSLSGMGLESLVGQQAAVSAYNGDTKQGQVKFSIPILGSDIWDMICEENVIPGDRVKVVDVLGNKLLVKKM